MKNRKTTGILLIALLLTLVLGMTACGGGGTTGKSEAGVPVIAFASNNLDETKALYIATWEEYFSRHPEAKFVWSSADGLAEKQVADVESFIAEGVSTIIIAPIDPVALEGTVDPAHEKGIKIVCWTDRIDHPDIDLTVGNDPYEFGMGQGEVIEAWLLANPDINLKSGFIRGDLASQQVADTYNGMMEVLKPYFDSGRVEIIVDNTAMWRSADAMQLTEDWIQAYPEMNCVIAQNDEMAIGAIQALKAAGKVLGTDTFVFGKDGNAHGQEYLATGEMEGTIFIDKVASGYYFIDIINRLTNGETFPAEMRAGRDFLGYMTPDDYLEVLEESNQKIEELKKL